MSNRQEIHGFVADGWGKVADVFRQNFEHPGEIGAACCVYESGRPVVDLWGGLADREANKPWREDTIAPVASTTKGATAICAHLLAQRGELDLDAPVARYWPEFGDAGKDKIPVRWLLSHQAGLPATDAQPTFEEVCAWDPVIRALEAQKPLWEPGTEHLYHAFTYGCLVGEVVRRVTGKSLGTFFAEEVAAPLGLSAWIGLPEDQEARVARVEQTPRELEDLIAGMIERTGLDPDTVTGWVEAVWGPGSVFARIGWIGGPDDLVNDRAYHAAEMPAGNMITDARSLARMYAATVTEVEAEKKDDSSARSAREAGKKDDSSARSAREAGKKSGVRLLEPATVERMTVVQTDTTTMHGLPPGLTVPADRSFYMSLGFWRACPGLRMAGPASFGHPGAGGSIGFADPDLGVGFGYVPNLWLSEVSAPRADDLADAVAACLA